MHLVQIKRKLKRKRKRQRGNLREGREAPPRRCLPRAFCFRCNLRSNTFEYVNFWSYRPQEGCIWSKIWCRSWFWRQKIPSSSKSGRKSWKTEKKLQKNFQKKIFGVKKLESCKSSEMRFAEVSRRSERSTKPTEPIDSIERSRDRPYRPKAAVITKLVRTSEVDDP